MIVHHHNQGRVEAVTHQEPLRKTRVARVQIMDLTDGGAATITEASPPVRSRISEGTDTLAMV